MTNEIQDETTPDSLPTSDQTAVLETDAVDGTTDPQVIDEDLTAHEPVSATDAVVNAPPTRRRLGKRGWIAIAVTAAVLIAGGAIAIPAAVQASELSAAQASFQEATADLDDARAAHTAADGAFEDRLEQAKTEYSTFMAISATVPADLVEPASVLDDFTAARTAFVEATGLTLNEDGTIAEEQALASFTVPTAPAPAATTTELLEQTADVTSDTEKTSVDTEHLAADTDAVDARYEDTIVAVDALVSAAAAKGATLTFEKAGQAEKDAFAAAVAGLVTEREGVPLTLDEKTAALSTYVSTRAAAQASHDATVAAEQAAAEEAERQKNESNNSNRTNGGTSGSKNTNGGTNNNGGSGTNNNTGGPGTNNNNNNPGTSTPARGSVSASGGSCIANYGSGGSVGPNNWTSNIVIPFDAVVTRISENAGVNWTVYFSC